MSGQDKQRKSKGVVLCRSKQQPTGKEIQGLVFDHPSMPKIVTISCGPGKKPSTGNHITGHQPRKEYNPAGEKYHPPREKYPSEYFNRQPSATGNCLSQPKTTVQYTPGQTYPKVHQTSAQCPPHSSPPALIHTPRKYSAQQATPPTLGDYHYRKSGSQFPNREGPQPEFPPQNGMSQIRLSSHTTRHDASTRIPLPPTTTRDMHVQYSQHGAVSQRVHETTLGENSFGKRSENGAQHRQNIAQHSQNVSQDTIELGQDDFSRDFHLNVWRESHRRAAMEWNSPKRGQDPPVRRLSHPAHSPLTSYYNVDGAISRYRSLSTTASEQPSSVFQAKSGHRLPAANPQGIPCPPNPPPRDMRRYSTGYMHLSYNANCPTGPQSSPEVRNYRQRVQSTGGTNTRVPSAGGIKRSNSTVEEYNPVVRNAEGRNPQVLNLNHMRIPSNNNGDYSLAARNAERRNLEELNAGEIQASTNTSEVNNPVIRNAEGRNHVPSANSIKNSSNFSSDNKSQANVQQHQSSLKKQHSPTVVVISDSEEEDMEILSPLSNSESDQDVFSLEPANKTAKPNDSTSRSESDRGCFITRVKSLRDDKEQSLAKSTTSSKTGKESREYDVNNNKSREGLATSYERSPEAEQSRKRLGSGYRSVLCEQEFEGQPGTRRVVMSEQAFDTDKRGRKRSSEDNTQYFVAGSAQFAGSPLDFALKKIRRISTDDIENFDTCRQSSQEKRARLNSGEIRKLTTHHRDMPTLIRSRSENDDQIGTQKFQKERSKSLTAKPKTFENKINGGFFNPDDIKKVDQTSKCKFLSKNEIARCKVCLDRSDVISRDEIRCHNCDRVLNENSPGNEVSRNVVNLPKFGPKPTGIVVGIKQDREVKQPLEADTMGSENTLKKMQKAEDVGLEKELKQLMERCIVGSEVAKNSGITNVVPDGDEIHKDKVRRGTVSNDVDVLHFSADVTCKSSKNHVKSTKSSRDQLHPSQQWEAYSIKLEQEQIPENCCDITQTNIKRNSWEELKRRFTAEEKLFSEGKRDSVSCSGILKRSHATHKHVYSTENVFNTAYDKSYKFHDATDGLFEQYKRQKSSEADVLNNSSDNLSESEALTSQNNCKNDRQCAKVTMCDVSESTYTEKNVESIDCATQTASTPDERVRKPSVETFNVGSIEAPSSNTQEFSPSEEKPYEIQPSTDKPHEIQPSEETPNENTTHEDHSFEANTQEKDLQDIQSLEVRPSEENIHDKKSLDTRSMDTRSPEIEPLLPGNGPEAAKTPQTEEQLSLQEWTDILKGRIAQVKESIEEETTPWKTKNKKKVLEKLENHLAWITGPSVDESIFMSRKMPFLQTVRKQYELMKKVRTQRQTMKSSDSALQIGENPEKCKGKAAKEVEVSKQKKEVKKTVKCKAKR